MCCSCVTSLFLVFRTLSAEQVLRVVCVCVCLRGPWFGFIQGVEGLRFKVLGLGFSGVRGGLPEVASVLKSSLGILGAWGSARVSGKGLKRPQDEGG